MDSLDSRQLYTSLKWSIILTSVLNIIVILIQYSLTITSTQIIYHLYVILSVFGFALTLYATYNENLNLIIVSGFALIVLFFLGAFARFVGAIIVMFIVILAVFGFAYMVRKEQEGSLPT